MELRYEIDIKKELKEHFNKAKEVNPSISLRAFAKKIEVSPSTLSEILNNKRAISLKIQKKLIKKLGLAVPEKYHIIQGEINLKKNQKITLKDFSQISDWYYFAILSLAEIPGFQLETSWVSQRLGITDAEAQNALDQLIKLQLLVPDRDNGSYKAVPFNFYTPTDQSNEDLKEHTRQSLQLAQESLEVDPVEKRDFSTVTLAIPQSKIPMAKKMITDFRKKLSRAVEEGEKEEVYKLAIQFFPLSR